MSTTGGGDGGHAEPGARRSRGRPSFPAERIVAAALQIVDDSGAQALSMRTLAGRLGCSTATLYSHFANRSALIIAVIDLVMGEVDLDAEDLSAATWQHACRRLSHATFDALSRHHNVASLLAEHPPIGPNAMAMREHSLAVLLHHGFPPPLAGECSVVLARYTLGFATQLVAPSATVLQISAALRGASPAKFPATAKVWANRRPSALEDEFAFGLDRILDGLTQLRASEQRPPHPTTS